MFTQELNLDPSVTSHHLSNLRSSTEYTARLQAVSEDQRSNSISTVFTTGQSVTLLAILANYIAKGRFHICLVGSVLFQNLACFITYCSSVKSVHSPDQN